MGKRKTIALIFFLTLVLTAVLTAGQYVSQIDTDPVFFNSEMTTTNINYAFNQQYAGSFSINVRNQDNLSVWSIDNQTIEGLNGTIPWDGKDANGSAVTSGLYSIEFAARLFLSNEYAFGGFFGSAGSGIGQFYYPWGMAIDSKGNIYVSDYANDRIQKFSSSFTFIKQWGTRGTGEGQFFHPTGIAIDSEDNIYVTEYDNNRIQKFNSEGAFLLLWGSRGTLPGQVKNPMGITVNSKNEILIADYANFRIQKFNSSGVYLSSWGTYGAGAGQFQAPVGVAVDKNDNVYVTDMVNRRLHVFDKNANYINGWLLDFQYPQGVAVDQSGFIYVSGYYDSMISKYDSTGKLISRWGSAGTDQMQLSGPSELVLDSSDNLYVVERMNHRIQKFTVPVAEDSAVCTVTVDNVVPVIEIAQIPEFTSNAVIPEISATDENLVETVIMLNGEAFESGTQLTADGKYVLSVKATDKASNLSEKAVEFNIDTQAPEILISGVDAGGIYNDSRTPEFTINDPHLFTFEVFLNDERYLPGSPISGDGEYALKVTATDKAGNSAEASLQFTIDLSSPVITVSGVEDGKQYNSEVTPVIDIQDHGPFSAEVTLNSEAYVSGNPVVLEGDYVLNINAVDTAGNRTEKQIRFTIDQTAPEISVNGVLNGSYYNSPVYPVVNVLGAENQSIKLNGVEFVSGTKVMNPGEYRLVVTASDLAGNESTYQLRFIIDLSAPAISVSGIEEGGIYAQPVSAAVNIQDGYLRSKIISLNDEGYVSGSLISNDGIYRLLVIASDLADNTSTLEINFKIDSLPPVIRVSGVDEGGMYNSAVAPVIEITEDNLKTSSMYLNGEIFKSGTEIDLDGAYQLKVSADDLAGNTAAATVSFTIDTKSPVILVSGVEDGGIYDTSVKPVVVIAEENLKSSGLYLNGEVFKSGTEIFIDGAFELVAEAEDMAGNMNRVTVRFSVQAERWNLSATHSPDPFFPGYEFITVKNNILAIDYTISGAAGNLKNLDCVILDQSGNIIRTLLDNAERQIGSFRLEWDGRDQNGKIVPDGEYSYKFSSDGLSKPFFSQFRKLAAVRIEKDLVHIPRILVFSGSEYREGCFLHSFLQSEGYIHKVVYSCGDFETEMNTGFYNVYMLNSSNNNMGGNSPSMRDDLLQKVKNGDGLIGIHFNGSGFNPFIFDGLLGDKRNIYGVKFLGTLQKDSYTVNLTDTPITESKAFNTSEDKIKVVELTEGSTCGYVISQKNNASQGKASNEGIYPVVVSNDYESGRTVLFTFNLNESASESAGICRDLIRNSIDHVSHPAILESEPEHQDRYKILYKHMKAFCRHSNFKGWPVDQKNAEKFYSWDGDGLPISKKYNWATLDYIKGFYSKIDIQVRENPSRVLPVEITMTGSSVPLKFDFTEKFGSIDGIPVSCLYASIGEVSQNVLTTSFTVEAEEVLKILLVLQIPELKNYDRDIEFSNISEVNLLKQDQSVMPYDLVPQKFLFVRSQTSRWISESGVSSSTAESEISSADENLADSDSDGIPDSWELAHGLDPYNSNDISEDPDGDGMSNYEEFLSMTDPQVNENLGANSVLKDIAHVFPICQETQWSYKNSDGEKLTLIVNGNRVINGESFYRLIALKNNILQHIRYYRHDGTGLFYGGYLTVTDKGAEETLFSSPVLLSGKTLQYGIRENSNVMAGDDIMVFESVLDRNGETISMNLTWNVENKNGHSAFRFKTDGKGPLEIVEQGITWTRVEDQQKIDPSSLLDSNKLDSFGIGTVGEVSSLKGAAGIILLDEKAQKNVKAEVKLSAKESIELDIALVKETGLQILVSKPDLASFEKEGLPLSDAGGNAEPAIFSVSCHDYQGTDLSGSSSFSMIYSSFNNLEGVELFAYVPLLSKWEKVNTDLNPDQSKISMSSDAISTYALVRKGNN